MYVESPLSQIAARKAPPKLWWVDTVTIWQWPTGVETARHQGRGEVLGEAGVAEACGMNYIFKLTQDHFIPKRKMQRLYLFGQILHRSLCSGSVSVGS